MSLSGRGSCDPEAVFELADGHAGGEGDRALHAHIEGCAGCRELYEREVELNRRLGAFDCYAAPGRSVSRMVAMALPTRTARARAAWAMLAVALSLSALLALEVSGRSGLMPLLDAAAWSSGALSGLRDVAGILLEIGGRWVAIVLIAGITLDLAIAAVVAAVIARRNRRTREA